MLVDKARAGGGDVDGFRYTSNGSISRVHFLKNNNFIFLEENGCGFSAPPPGSVTPTANAPSTTGAQGTGARTHLIFPFSFSTKLLFFHPSSVCRTHLHRLVDLPSSKAVDCGRKTHLGNPLLVPYHAMCRDWDSRLRRKGSNASHYSAAACFRFPYIF